MSEPAHVDREEIEERLQEAFSRDPETSFLGTIARGVRDPAMPRDETNRPRLHPVWLTLALAGLAALGAFLYFSFWRS